MSAREISNNIERNAIASSTTSGTPKAGRSHASSSSSRLFTIGQPRCPRYCAIVSQSRPHSAYCKGRRICAPRLRAKSPGAFALSCRNFSFEQTVRDTYKNRAIRKLNLKKHKKTEKDMYMGRIYYNFLLHINSSRFYYVFSVVQRNRVSQSVSKVYLAKEHS